MTRWLVDGSNVVGARPDGWWRDRAGAFARLVLELERFARTTGDEVTVVFDGDPPSPAPTGVEVHGAPSADDRLVELVVADTDPASLTAVTSDRHLAERLRHGGATVVGAKSFRRRLDAGLPVVVAQVASVSVGRVRTFEYRGRSRTTGIWKEAVPGRVAARGVNLEGDEQADRRLHGGADKAVYAYARADYAWWEGELGRHLEPGTFGENLLLDGIDLRAAVVGERWRVGTTELEVCQPRTPCWKLGVRMDDDAFPDRFDAAGRLGAYLRIAGEGELGAGDDVLLVHRPAHGVTLDLVWRAFDDPSLFPAVLAAPELPERLRTQMQQG